MIDLLQTLQEEFRTKIATIELSGFVKRNVTFTQAANKINVAVGMRRTGKTYLLFQEIAALLAAGIEISQILYLNFEDDRLLPMTTAGAADLLDGFYSLYPQNHNRECYLFLDEIQNIPNWATLVRRFYDTKKLRIFLTGSSAKLLSKEIATQLRGRSLATEVLPYSFNEYLRARKATPTEELRGRKTIDNLRSHFSCYLEQGGFPEIVSLNDGDRVRILQDYVAVVTFRDIVERHKVTNHLVIEWLLKRLLNTSAALFSINKFYNELKTRGIAVSRETIHTYLKYIEDAYLCFGVPVYSESIRKMQINPQKIYAIDTGLVQAYDSSFSKNFGRMFENLIYLELRRKGYKIYYYLTQNRFEVDFFVKDISGNNRLFQVVWDDKNPETMEREQRALAEAEEELKIKGEIITLNTYLAGKMIPF